jgi:hypothetical protein
MRKKGDIEKFNLGAVLKIPAFDSIEIGIKHIGPNEQRIFSYRMQQARYKEMRRIPILREGLSREQAPELYDERLPFITEEGLTEMREISGQLMDKVIAEVTGPVDGETLEEKVTELKRYEIAELLIEVMIGVQSLAPALTFLVTSTSNAGPPAKETSEP